MRAVRACLLVALCSACGDGRASERLESRLLRDRFVSGRLAGQGAWGPCDVVDTTALVRRVHCAAVPEPGSRAFEEITSLSQRALAPGRDRGARGARLEALLDLRWQARAPQRVAHAIATLAGAATPATHDGLLLNDLAVAHLARAEQDQDLHSLLQALETIERARAERAAPEILYNRALILERLYLVESARDAWGQYLAVEHDSAWRRDAEMHRRALAGDSSAITWNGDVAAFLASGHTSQALAASVGRSPQEGRDAALAVLGEWGRALLGGDSSTARRALLAAHALSRSVGASTADQSLTHAMASIDAALAGPPAIVRIQALAHRDLADGRTMYGRAAYDDAKRRLLRAARAMHAYGSPIAGWASLYAAASALNLGEYATADSILRTVIADTGPELPALRGKAVWARGVVRIREGALETAHRFYREAAPYMAEARESENMGMLSTLIAEGLALAGQTAAGRVEAHRALQLLAPFRRSDYLSADLGLAASAARRDGLHRAALAIWSEVLAATSVLDKPQVMAWAHGERARDLIALGDSAAAHTAVAEAVQWVERIEAGRGRDEIRADILLVRGQLLRATDPRAARRELLDAVAAYRASNSDVRVPDALYQAALATRDAGDTTRARAYLTQAVTEIETRRDLFPTAEVRATFYETTEAVFDEKIALELDRGRPDLAFAYLERVRMAAWGRGEAKARPPGWAAATRGIDVVRRAMPEGTVAVEYAVLPNRLVIWTMTRDAWHSDTIAAGRDSVAALVARFAAEASLTTPPIGGASEVLYDLLLRPVAPELAGAKAVAIIPDRELSQLPFVALRDRETGRYVLEGPPVRTLPSAAFLGVSPPRRRAVRGAEAQVLVVGDPAVDTTERSATRRLRGATAEAAAVAQLYRAPRLLMGARARRDTLLALLPTSSVLHFAGHAIANAEQPELSYLALGAGDGGDDGVLRAREIGRLRLSNLTIAVLSACSTLDARPTHVGAVAGLAYSFLRAGVPATVSSLWDVDDDATTQLLVAFHRQLADGVAAATALRAAQLDALRSRHTGAHAPRVWAAFIYTGS